MPIYLMTGIIKYAIFVVFASHFSFILNSQRGLPVTSLLPGPFISPFTGHYREVYLLLRHAELCCPATSVCNPARAAWLTYL